MFESLKRWWSGKRENPGITIERFPFLLNGGEENWSGETSSPWNLSCYRAGLKCYSDTISTLGLECFSYKSGEEVEHPYSELFETPNPEYHGQTLIAEAETLRWHRGNAYIELVRDGTGAVKELWNIDPTLIQVLFSPQGNLYYRFNGETDYSPTDLIHLKGLPSGDPYVGTGLLHAARQDVGLSISQEKFTSKYLRNSAKMSGVYTYPEIMPDEIYDQFMSKLERHNSSLEHAGKSPILENGLAFAPISFSPADSELLSQRQYQVEVWARWFSLPPQKLQRYADMKWANVEQAQTSFVQDSIRPVCIQWERELNSKLWSKREKALYYLRFDLTDLMRGDDTTFMAYLVAGVQNKILTLDEAREKLGLPEIEQEIVLDQPTHPEPFSGYNLPLATGTTTGVEQP